MNIDKMIAKLDEVRRQTRGDMKEWNYLSYLREILLAGKEPSAEWTGLTNVCTSLSDDMDALEKRVAELEKKDAPAVIPDPCGFVPFKPEAKPCEYHKGQGVECDDYCKKPSATEGHGKIEISRKVAEEWMRRNDRASRYEWSIRQNMENELRKALGAERGGEGMSKVFNTEWIKRIPWWFKFVSPFLTVKFIWDGETCCIYQTFNGKFYVLKVK
jgi:hypothetical protein